MTAALLLLTSLAQAQMDCPAVCTTAEGKASGWECGIVPCVDNDRWKTVDACSKPGGTSNPDYHPMYEDDLERMSLRHRDYGNGCNLYTRPPGSTESPHKFAEMRCISDPEHPGRCHAEGAHTDGSFRVSRKAQAAGCPSKHIDYIYVLNHNPPEIPKEKRGTTWGYCTNPAKPSGEICVPCTMTGSPTSAPTVQPTFEAGTDKVLFVRDQTPTANCTVHGNCVSNRAHGPHEECNVEVLRDSIISATYFEVETVEGCAGCSCDCLRIGGANGPCGAKPTGDIFCGETGPDKVKVKKGTYLRWSSDGGLNRGGFTLCAEPASPSKPSPAPSAQPSGTPSSQPTPAPTGAHPGCTNAPATAKYVEASGYPMDNFCIKRGTLLDAPQYQTLVNPEKHSIHCLVDVSVCYGSGYALLTEPDAATGRYKATYQLGAKGTDTVRAAGKAERNALGEQTGWNITVGGFVDASGNMHCVKMLDGVTVPTPAPTAAPTADPTPTPSVLPSSSPSSSPSAAPSVLPSSAPSPAPSAPPSALPSETPSAGLTRRPSGAPTRDDATIPPTASPVASTSPTAATGAPSGVPTEAPAIEALPELVAADADGDGMLNFSESKTALPTLDQSDFDAADIDNNKQLDAAELKAAEARVAAKIAPSETCDVCLRDNFPATLCGAGTATEARDNLAARLGCGQCSAVQLTLHCSRANTRTKDKEDDSSNDTTTVAVVVVLVVLVIVAVAVVLYRKQREAGGKEVRNVDAASFENPMYDHSAPGAQPQAAVAPSASTGYMDVAVMPATNNTGYMDVSPPEAVDFGGYASDGEEDV